MSLLRQFRLQHCYQHVYHPIGGHRVLSYSQHFARTGNTVLLRLLYRNVSANFSFVLHVKHELRHKTVISPLYKAAVGAAFSILQWGSPFEQQASQKFIYR